MLTHLLLLYEICKRWIKTVHSKQSMSFVKVLFLGLNTRKMCIP